MDLSNHFSPGHSRRIVRRRHSLLSSAWRPISQNPIQGRDLPLKSMDSLLLPYEQYRHPSHSGCKASKRNSRTNHKRRLLQGPSTLLLRLRHMCRSPICSSCPSCCQKLLPICKGQSGGVRFHRKRTKKNPQIFRRKFAGEKTNSGSVLLFHTVTHAVPLAQAGLTSEFEMRSGVSPPL